MASLVTGGGRDGGGATSKAMYPREEEEDHKKEEGGGEGFPTRTSHECELSQMQEEVMGLMVLGWRQQKSGGARGEGGRGKAKMTMHREHDTIV